MNNYYILIYLNRELKETILGGKFLFSISPHKDVLECYIKTKKGTNRLITSTNPGETALFLDDYRPPKKRNVLEFFNRLEGQRIVDISLAKYDRLFTIQFENDFSLVFKLYGSDVNILLVKDEIIEDAFKHPESIKGQKAPKPSAPTFASEITDKAKPKNQITKLNPLLPRNLLRSLIKQHQVSEMYTDGVKKFTNCITRALLNSPNPRVLENGKLCLWSEKMLSLPTEKSFNLFNDAVRFTYYKASHLRRLHNKKDRIQQFLERSLNKKKAEYEQLQQADKSLERADKYEKYGHLLMAHAHETVTNDTDELKVADFYEENEPITIPFKSELSIAKNAENYYEKATSARTSHKKAKERAPKIKKEIQQIDTLINEHKEIKRLHNLNKWIKKHDEKLRNLGYGINDERQSSSPYRKFKKGKYEIWIGKNAKSNDKLTSLAHKEDIWLHARGVGGSHTVIRMGNQKEYPPKEIILHAASYAAYFSKAKGVKTAPVIYTKRKYIHKPKGGAAGAVVVDREEVVMVPPVKPG